VALAVQGAPFGMADDDVATAELGEHRRRHFAGERARRVTRAILAAPRDRAAVEQRRDVAQVRRGYADRHFGGAERGRLQRRQQRRIRGDAGVHLPVADDELSPPGRGGRRPCRYHVSTSLPMCWFDSISAWARAASAAGKTWWITGL